MKGELIRTCAVAPQKGVCYMFLGEVLHTHTHESCKALIFDDKTYYLSSLRSGRNYF